MKPHRVQLSRKKGWKMPPNTVKVDRTTPWGNPYKVRPAFTTCRGVRLRLGPTAYEAVKMFRDYMTRPGTTGFELAACVRRDLRGKNLACWCKIFVCPNCKAEYDDEEMRPGFQCTNNISRPGHGGFRCQGIIERQPCHADVLLEIANS